MARELLDTVVLINDLRGSGAKFGRVERTLTLWKAPVGYLIRREDTHSRFVRWAWFPGRRMTQAFMARYVRLTTQPHGPLKVHRDK